MQPPVVPGYFFFRRILIQHFSSEVFRLCVCYSGRFCLALFVCVLFSLYLKKNVSRDELSRDQPR